jgi:hypothetical protein
MRTIDEQSGATSGNEVLPYVIETDMYTGVDNNGASFTTSGNNNNGTYVRLLQWYIAGFKAMLHGAIFLATCNVIILLGDVKLPNTSLHYTPLMFSKHIENSSLISLINISEE